ncbi:MAG: hypothetical protein V1789_06275 [PVC group bacterium]
MKSPDMLAALRPVISAFEDLGIHYYIGGSVAGSAYGKARSTLDVDLASDIKLPQVRSLVEKLQSTYYIDEESILDAIKRHSSFNLIHLDTMIKVDVFVSGDNPYSRELFRRRRKDGLAEDREDEEFYLISPEDLILVKLDWYRRGGEVSERQWDDVLGIITVQGDSLDREYLHHWARELNLGNLLERAFNDATVG